MSFERHRQIYQSDGPWAGRETSPALEKPGATLAAAPGAHRLDEFAAGYSLAGCSPAEPASASPARTSVRRYSEEGKRFAVNRNLSRFRLSHAWGSLPPQMRSNTRIRPDLPAPKGGLDRNGSHSSTLKRRICGSKYRSSRRLVSAANRRNAFTARSTYQKVLPPENLAPKYGPNSETNPPPRGQAPSSESRHRRF